MIKVDKKTINQLKKASKINVAKLGNICAYCGAYGDTRDHVIPLSFFSEGRPYSYRQHYKSDNIVRACHECNCVASNIVFENFWEKKKYLADMIAWRYKDLLKSPDWTDREIKELSGTLKNYIKNCEYIKKFIKLRIENLNTQEICE